MTSSRSTRDQENNRRTGRSFLRLPEALCPDGTLLRQELEAAGYSKGEMIARTDDSEQGGGANA